MTFEGMWEIFQTIVFGVVAFMEVHMIKGVDTYIEKKAENFATKEDIGEITSITQSVQNDYKKIMDDYEADLKFKYQFLEKQYTQLYSKLYRIICISESMRKIFNDCGTEMNLYFEDAPLVEIEEDGSSNTKLNEIVELIDNSIVYASPELYKLISQIGIIKQERFSHWDGKGNYRRKLEKDLIRIILLDYNRLRNELKMSSSENEYDLLKKGDFLKL